VRPVPAACLTLIHEFEQGPHGGFSPKVYKDPAGFDTIGYGHRVAADDPLHEATLDAVDADALAIKDLTVAATALCEILGDVVITSLTDNQYAALIDFNFNEGAGKFEGSTMCRFVRQGWFDAVAREFHKWVYATVDGRPTVLEGLVNRRNAEKALWLQPV
jgi:lysozyme